MNYTVTDAHETPSQGHIEETPVTDKVPRQSLEFPEQQSIESITRQQKRNALSLYLSKEYAYIDTKYDLRGLNGATGSG